MSGVMKVSTEWSVTNHAIQRVKERYNLRNGAGRWINAKIRRATYASNVIDKNGIERRLFAVDGVNFIVDLTKNIVITVIPARDNEAVATKLHKFATQELTKVRRKETYSLRKIERLRAEIECEMGEVRLRLLRARSVPTKLALQARMKALRMRLDELPTEEFEVRRELTRTATALAKVL